MLELAKIPLRKILLSSGDCLVKYSANGIELSQGFKKMATADQVKALIRSHAEGDNDRFYAIAMQVVAQEENTGSRRKTRGQTFTSRQSPEILLQKRFARESTTHSTTHA